MSAPTPPSFQPWLGRVRMARAWGSIIGLVVVSALGRTAGRPWDDSLLYGIGAAVVLFFVVWATTLWLFGELYGAQIERMVRVLRQQEDERAAQLQEMYEARMRQMQGIGPDDPIDTSKFGALPGAPQQRSLRDAA